MRQLREWPESREYKAKGRVKLVGAVYKIETGQVRFFD
jgi:carbonic anhydrase